MAPEPAMPVTLDSLAALPRWVAWQVQDGKPDAKGTVRKTKVPYAPGGSMAHSDKPRTWGARRACERRAALLPLPYGMGGTGLVLGDMGDGRTLGGIDLDSCRDAAGTLAPWAQAVIDRLASYTETSPSGTGVKLFFLVDAADVAALAPSLSDKLARQFKVKGDDHPEGIELYLSCRYFAVTGDHLASTPAELRPVSLAALRWVLDVAGPALKGDVPKAAPGQRQAARKGSAAGKGQDAPSPALDAKGAPPGLLDRIEASTAAHATLRRRWAGDWAGLRDESGSGRAFALAAALRKAGFDRADTLAGLRLHPDTREWVETKGDAAGGREMARVWDNVQPAPAAGDEPGDVPDKPQLQVIGSDLPATARAVRDLLAAGGNFYDRGGVLVKLAHPADGGPPVAIEVTPHGIVCEAHRLCQPVAWTGDTLKPVTLAERVAKMVLDMRGDWRVPALDGVTTAPVLAHDGAILDRDGYDPQSRLWCAKVPALDVPDRPTRAQAEAALVTLRTAFQTFPFGDSPRKRIGKGADALDVVDLAKPPMLDETAALAALLTAVCRPSLHLAPGFLVTAAALSGSGAGKGLLVRAINAIAFGVPPRAFTAGTERTELDKRLAAELIEAAPAVFLDNVNGQSLKSDLLANVLTERPARVRVLGKSQMVPLNSVAFISLTGNGLSVSEDLARRFLSCNLDAQTENPENRPFKPGYLGRVQARRPELLAAALTIWRWGRQNPCNTSRGLHLGSFGEWAEWVRDPLIELGCADPMQRIQEAKASDPRRRQVFELFDAWWQHHHDGKRAAKELHDEVKEVADPAGRGRQHLAGFLDKLTGTRAAGFVLEQHKAAGKWGTTRYGLKVTDLDVVNARAAARREADAGQPQHGYPDDPGPQPD